MKIWLMKTASVGILCAGCLGVGILLGAKKPLIAQANQAQNKERFVPVGNNDALDTWTGKTCSLSVMPAGFTDKEGSPSCENVTKQ
jgi:hypothetical protein